MYLKTTRYKALALYRSKMNPVDSGRRASYTKNMNDIVDPKLLDVLVCPLTKEPLRYDRDTQELISPRAKLAYPIRDGIPIMLTDEARALTDAECAKIKAKK